MRNFKSKTSLFAKLGNNSFLHVKIGNQRIRKICNNCQTNSRIMSILTCNYQKIFI